MSWREFRRLYPITSRLAYLNNASMGPLPSPVRQALEAHMDRWQHEHLSASIGIDHSEALREAAARFISATPGEIALTGGVTDGLFRAVSLVRPAAGENVVLPANEFPSAVYPWRRFEKGGVQLRFAGPREGPVTEEHLMGAADEATRVICASLVSFADGTRLDIAALSEFCLSRSIVLVVDAMQAAGAIVVDVARAPVDFLAFGPVKWIPAPVGAGVLYVRKGWEDKAEGRWLGWRSVARTGLQDLLDYDLPPYSGARRLDGGSPAIMSHVGLEAALGLLQEAGLDRIEQRVVRLAGQVATLLGEEGFMNVGPAEEGRRAGIVVCDPPAPAGSSHARSRSVQTRTAGIVAGLAEDGVIVAERNGRIRISAHAFNDENDLDRLRIGLRNQLKGK